MGKRIIAQRRGRGSPTYRTPSYKFKPKIRYKDKPGKVKDILNDPLRNTPLAKIVYEDKSTGYILAPQGIKVGDDIENVVLPLEKTNVGDQIFSIETYPNSGPKLCRTSGSSAMIVSKSKKECIILLPSKKNKKLNLKCRATLGIPAGEGRGELPWVKAGKKWIAMHRRGKLYPRTSGSSMNAIDHPFGGSYTGLGRAKTVSRSAPPGRKVGTIASRRTGRRRGKR